MPASPTVRSHGVAISSARKPLYPVLPRKLRSEFDAMTPAEHIELINRSFELIANSTMNFISVLSAYLGTAFFVGSRLTKFQVWSLTALYTIFLSFPGSAAVSNNFKIIALRKWFSEEYPVDSARISDAVPLEAVPIEAVYLLIAILILAWMLSLLFMFRIRRNEDEIESLRLTRETSLNQNSEAVK